MTMMIELKDKSFLQQWGALIAFGASVSIFLAGVRFWLNKAVEAPIDESYAIYLNSLAANSHGAAEYLENYYKKYSRRSIQSQHFRSVCGAVTDLAVRDGFTPEKVSAEIAYSCRRRGGY